MSVQLARGERGPYEVSIYHVDNGSNVAAELTSEQKATGVHLLRNEINRGYAGGIRGAIAQIRRGGRDYDAYYILNCDLETEPDALLRLMNVLAKYPKVAVVGPRVMKGHSEKVWGERGVVSPMLGMTAMTEWPTGGVLPRWSYIPGSSMLVRREAYDEAGGIPDRYRLYYEETELCVQLQKLGWDLWVEPSAKVYHIVNSLKDRVPARHYAFYFARNNLYFWKHNFGIPAFVQLPRTMFVITKELVLPLRRADSVATFTDRLKFVAAGFADGFLFLRRRYTYFEKKFFKIIP
ncbi:MAG TPA: glycosyltransferase family 2 protein [Bdellovibrionales bacterium]|nr:glycosyltransferase family 2 protein [Bdellovibrionales bacterium]